MTTILSLRSIDLRFPTSLQLDGSYAMHPDPDYSAAYVILETDTHGLEGHGGDLQAFPFVTAPS